VLRAAPPRAAGPWYTRAVSSVLRDEIAESVERTLLEEARRNELTVGYVRAATLLATNGLDWFAYRFPQLAVQRDHHSLTVPLLSGLWLLVALAVAAALRRGRYHPAMRLWLPLLDGALILVLFANFLRVFGAEHFVRLGQLTVVGIACTLLAASGSLRLTRAAAVLTTAMGLAIYAALSIYALALSTQVVLGLVVLLGTGLLSVRMTAVVRRAVESEIGRATLERFLPAGVITSAHRDPLALVTAPRGVSATILVSDLRGFTGLAEKLAPEVVLALLNEVQGAFAAEVRVHGGMVDKFMGDGMLAVFRELDGGPLAAAGESPADHPARALRAANAMCAATVRINAAWARRGLAPVRIGVGVHTGPVVVGCLGSGARLEFTVIGDTVNTAARLEALTKEHGVAVLVSEETARRAGGAAGALTPIGEVAIRGRSEPLRVHALVPESEPQQAGRD
jgi:adenylate cyclase